MRVSWPSDDGSDHWQVRRCTPRIIPNGARTLCYCVPATFALLYFIDSDRLVPLNDDTGEGHWWLAGRTPAGLNMPDANTNAELAGVYRPADRVVITGGEAPAARFLKYRGGRTHNCSWCLLSNGWSVAATGCPCRVAKWPRRHRGPAVAWRHGPAVASGGPTLGREPLPGRLPHLRQSNPSVMMPH